MAKAHPKQAHLDDELMAHIAAAIARASLTPVDPGAPNLISWLADIFRQRARVGWTTRLSPETTMLVADALDAYAPAPPPVPLPPSPGARLAVDMYSQGSTIYRLDRHGELAETVAWAKSSIVAGTAFDKLVQQYPHERFLQKRRSWVERP